METSVNIIRIKRICAVLLLISFLLPFSRGCSQTEMPFQKDHVKEEKKQLLNTEEDKGKTRYAYDIIRSPEISTDTAAVVIFCYVWPIPVLFCRRFTKRKFVGRLLSGAELAFCVGTFYFLNMMGMFDKLLIGAYLALSSSVVYFCSTAFDLTKELFHYFKTRTH